MTLNRIKIIIPGNPIAQARPRVTKWGTYDTRYKEKKAIKAILSSKVKYPLEGALKAEFTFYMPIPKSTSKKNRELMLRNEIKHVKKPDTSNILKMYEDCMNGIAYHDDSAIWNINAKKLYGDEPRTEIILTYI